MRCVLLCFAFLPPAFADDTNGREQQLKSARESIREVISEVEMNLQQARDESEQLLAELQKLESSSLSAKGKLDRLDAELAASDSQIARLNQQQRDAEANSVLAREKLAQQLRATYITGRHNMLKLVLNQEDPTQLSRLIAYHDYINQARGRQIAAIEASLLHIAELKQQITEASQGQRELQQAQQNQLAKIAEVKSQREGVLDRLNQQIADRDNHLKTLRRTETELSQLLQGLSDDSSRRDGFENIPPFQSLQGKLSLPVQGDIDTRFGAYKKGGRIKATGVTFNTKRKAKVKAIASGQVIFADWFRNLGLLLIINHGDDYISLYGHNAAIVKRTGDWVKAGETISIAGETGGRENTSLYFEIRKQGTPLNPLHWCKREQPIL